MKKNEKLAELIGKCDDRFIEASDISITPVAKKRFSVIPFVAAAACMCIVGGGVYITSRQNNIADSESTDSAYSQLQNNSDSASNTTYENSADEFKDATVEGTYLYFEQMSVFEKYDYFEFCGYDYFMSNTTLEFTEDDLSQEYYYIKVLGYNSDTQESHTEIVKIYEINTIDAGYAVAVKYPDDDKYYFYTNDLYQTQSLGELIDGLNLEEYAESSCPCLLGTVCNGSYSNEYVDITDMSFVWDFLDNYRDAESIENYDFDKALDEAMSSGSTEDTFCSYIQFDFNAEALGKDYTGFFSFTRDGYLFTNLTSTGRAYYLGENAFYELLALIDKQKEKGTESENEHSQPKLVEDFGLTFDELRSKYGEVVKTTVLSGKEGICYYFEGSDCGYGWTKEYIDGYEESNCEFDSTESIPTPQENVGCYCFEELMFLSPETVPPFVVDAFCLSLPHGEPNICVYSEDDSRHTVSCEYDDSFTIGMNEYTAPENIESTILNYRVSISEDAFDFSENDKMTLTTSVAQAIGKPAVVLDYNTSFDYSKKISTMFVETINDISKYEIPTGGSYILNVTEEETTTVYEFIGKDILCVNKADYYRILNNSDIIDDFAEIIMANE